MKKIVPHQPASTKEISDFLQRVKQTPRASGARSAGRLAFIIDATASRQPTWDHACQMQGEMFKAVEKVGSLQVQLAYFRGFDEFKATAWIDNTNALLRLMSGVTCLAGHTQIIRVLQHLVQESGRQRIAAAVYIGDACEENSKKIFQLAGQLGVLKTPMFMFQEGRDTRAARVFETVGSLSGGAYCRFDASSASLLAELLSAVAVYAAGGQQALIDMKNKSARIQHITRQLPGA